MVGTDMDLLFMIDITMFSHCLIPELHITFTCSLCPSIDEDIILDMWKHIVLALYHFDGVSILLQLVMHLEFCMELEKYIASTMNCSRVSSDSFCKEAFGI